MYSSHTCIMYYIGSTVKHSPLEALEGTGFINVVGGLILRGECDPIATCTMVVSDL